MLNLSNLALRVKKAEPPKEATVSAVILAKGDEALAGEARAVLTAEGLNLPNTKVFDDGSLALFDSEDFEQGSTLVRLNDHMAVVVKGFEPYGSTLDGLSFGQAAAARGYYDSVRGAMSVLQDIVNTKLYKSDSPASAATEIQKALDEFNKYVVELTRGLPAAVFKSEERVASLVNAYEPAPVAKVEQPSEPTSATPAPAQPQEPVVKVEEAKPADTSPALDKLVSAVNGLVETVSAIQKSVDGLGQKVEKIELAQQGTEQKVADALKKAEDAAQVLKSTVVGTATGNDTVAPQPVRKADGDPRTGVFDSALIPRNTRR